MRMQVILSFALLLLATVVAADVRVQLHLKRVTSEDVIEGEFQARSTPGNAKYQQHLSHEQLTTLVRGRPESLEAAERFFAGAAGVKKTSVFSTKDAVTAVLSEQSPVARALGIKASMFQASEVRHSVPVPAELAAHVERIVVVPPKSGKKQRGPKAHYAKAGGQLPFPGAAQTPGTIGQRYNVPNTTLPATAVQGVGEFQQSYFKQSWMRAFSQKYNLPNPDIRVVGPNSPSQDDIEGTLDLEYITGIAPGATTWWISSNDTNTVDPFSIDFAWWCDVTAQLSPMPTVVSLSWGIGENNYDAQVDVLHTDNDAFRKLGLLGVSVFAASGDTGPGSRGYTSCSRFDPGWPASSPYLTAVGATYANAGAPEVSVSFSGGGFSDFFPTPSWQKQAVDNYLSTASGVPASTYFNASGRAFPDVSALGTNFMVYGANQFGQEGWMPIAGTSAASPTFAAVITRINSMRVAAGQSTLGFLNPTIYQMGKVGYDVVSGASVDPDCYGFNFPGFPTAAGWDPVSGLGTPDVSYLASKLVGSGEPPKPKRA